MARFQNERTRGLNVSTSEYIDTLTDALGVLRDNIGERYIVQLIEPMEINVKSTEKRRKKFAGDMQIEIVPRSGKMFDDITQEQVDHQRMINRRMKLQHELQPGNAAFEVVYRHKPNAETAVLKKAIELGVIHPSSIAMFTMGGLRGRQGEWTDQIMGDKFVQGSMDMGQGIDVLYGGPISRMKQLDAGHIKSADHYPKETINPDNTRWEDKYDNRKWQEKERAPLVAAIVQDLVF